MSEEVDLIPVPRELLHEVREYISNMPTLAADNKDRFEDALKLVKALEFLLTRDGP